MIQGNYTAKAMGGMGATLEILRERGFTDDVESVVEIGKRMREAQPFYINEEDGLIFNRGRDYLPSVFRLPYPCIALEYKRSNGIKVLALCSDKHCIPPDGDKISIVTFTAMKGLFFPSASCLVGPSSADDKDVTFVGEEGEAVMPVVIQVMETLPKYEAALREFQGLSKTELRDIHAGGLSSPIEVLLQLLCALECKNVRIDDLPPPEKLQEKRRRAGKLPLLTYKVLTIESDAKTINTTPGEGTHASPRTHLRRGHIRRLTTGNIWVNATVVNGKTKGFVAKDYRVEGASA